MGVSSASAERTVAAGRWSWDGVGAGTGRRHGWRKRGGRGGERVGVDRSREQGGDGSSGRRGECEQGRRGGSEAASMGDESSRRAVDRGR